MEEVVPWWELARCKGRESLFYLDEPTIDDISEMRGICSMCPVSEQCEAAGDTGAFGEQFYAGLTVDEHRRKRRKPRTNHGPVNLSKQAAREREAIHRCNPVVLDLLVLAEVPGEQFAEIIDTFCKWCVERDPAWTYEDAQERAFLVYERLQAKLEAA